MSLPSNRHSKYLLNPIYRKGGFTRLDEEVDSKFYSTDRFVSHIDRMALSTVERLIKTLIIEKNAVILDFILRPLLKMA